MASTKNISKLKFCGKSAEWVFSSCLFFFSSRRRHTRSLRDWSSDVFSSDLSVCVARDVQLAAFPLAPSEWTRSEERRVGKECRYRWAPYHSKKKTDRSPA